MLPPVLQKNLGFYLLPSPLSGLLVVHWGSDGPHLRYRNSLGLARLLEETKHYVYAAYLGSKLTLE